MEEMKQMPLKLEAQNLASIRVNDSDDLGKDYQMLYSPRLNKECNCKSTDKNSNLNCVGT